MKRNIKNFMIKAFSMCLAFILVFPTNLFAMSLDNTKYYKASASIMGLAQTDTTSQDDNEVTDQTLLETEITKKETDKYLIEKYARLSKTTGQIEYMIKVHPKDEESKDKITTSFAISKNTDLKDLKIEKISQIHSDNSHAEIKYQEQRPSILYNNDAFETLGVTTDKADLVYYLSAQLSEEALGKIDEKTPSMDLDINVAEAGANLYQDRYALSIDKMEVVGEDGEDTIETLKEKENPTHQVKAIYKEGSSNLLGENPGEITWTDFIHADDDKEFTTDIKLDEGQDATDSQIKVEFYQANEKGYTLKEDFTKEIPFTESLKLQIPLGFIAKVELKTKVTENKKEYSLNQTKIPNPIYKEEKTEERPEEDDADPLPEETSKTEESKGTSEEKIIPIDPETNEAVIDHSLVSEDDTEETKSAINLNRDSVINNFKNNEKLNPVVEITINNISSLFNAYNKDEMTYEEFLANLKSQAKDLSKEEFAEIVQGLIAGLNQETYKVANIDEDQLLAEVYGKDEAEEQATEEKPVTETTEADTEETSNAENGNVETETTEDFRTPEDKIKDNALESFDKSLNQAKEASKKPQEDDRSLIGNISEGIKGIFGQSNLQKADQELKAALAEGKSLEEIQGLLNSFEENYQLSREEQVKLMEDNGDAIKALIAKDSETNFRPHIFAASELKLDGKKFHVLTRFDTSTVNGPIKKGQYFNIHLDDKLTVKNPKELKSIYNGNTEIAKPSYDEANNIIKYEILNDIKEKLQIPLDIPVDYKTNKIELDENGEFVVVNKVSGLGVTDPKSLLPQRVDRNGNLAATIIEPEKKEVAELIEVDMDPYRVYTDANATPVIKDGKLLGFNWTIKVTSDTDLFDLGYKANFTTVKGSGLEKIEDRNKSLGLTDQLDGAFGINDSKHHKVDQAGIREVTYNLYTPVEETPQEKYMMDISIILTEKGKVGAKRIVVNEGWPIEKVREKTPSRVGMNNRTTILGEFANESTAKWTVTDAVSTGDKDVTLPLENRQLQGDQTGSMGQTAAYKIDPSSGMMVNDDTGANGSKPVGTIAVYEYTGAIGEDQKDPQTLGGVSISRYQDVTVDQNWNLPDGQKMPSQTITVTDKDGNKSETKVKEGPVVSDETGKQRIITVPGVKYWDIDNNGNASFRDHTISQTFPQGKGTINGKEYKYSENANYYRPDTRVHYIQNSLEEDTDKKPATFTVIKVDSKDPEKRITGASFDLLGANVSITTDANGEATFRNIKPGRYYLTETKAPDGYKIDQNQKTIEISDNGQITVYGGNAKLSAGSGKTAIVEHSDYPSWPDFMNTMHYGKLDDQGNLEFYVYLKPFAPRLGGRTDKDTRFNISIPGVDLTNANVTVHDLDPEYREYYTIQMQDQTMDKAIIFDNVIGKTNKNGVITGTPNSTDPYTGKTGYSISIPAKRFGDDWGFLVKVNAKVGTDKNPITLTYDWLADKDTATNSKIQEAVTVSTNNEENGHPTITITNEAFKKSSIEVAKFADSLDSEGNKIKLPGAEFVLKDANGKPITTAYTKKEGKVDFGEFPPGTYYLEEQTAPAGYEKSDVYFEVKVNEKGEVTYTAKFKTSSGTPVPGQDYFIEKGEATSSDAKAEVLEIHQHMDVKDSGIGRFQGIWEAYELESLKYKLDARLNIAGPGARFEIQFDKNLDFTQYFTEFPDLYKDGKVIAKPYFDRNTNLLTYVFTENAAKGETTVSLNLVGMIPNKFYAKTHGKYKITNVVAPGVTVTDPNSNQTETIDVDAYFGEYDAKRDYNHKPLSSPPSQAYYFRDVYQDENGQWYVKAFAYYNPYGLYSGGAKNINFNWMSTNYQKDKIQHEWNANGNLPAFQLDNVKVYRTDKRLTNATYNNGTKDITEEVSAVMPLSMGIRPEQDPSTYRKVFETNIDPGSFKSASSNDVYLEYNPKEIKSDSTLQYDAPLKMTMPKISGEKEGYVIEQTFKIPDIKKFNENWRAFYMGQNTVLRSTFVTGPNKNYGNADQTGQEIPKFYKEIVGIINRKFTPGQFKITKTEDNTGKALQGAVFTLTDASGNTIYRSSDTNGFVEFKNLEPGRYTLRESQAPKGYTGSKEKWEVIVSNDGSVRIEETSVTGSGDIYTGNNTNVINIPVTNRKIGENFQVFKKGEDGKPLKGATFTITKQGETNPIATVTSDANGLVEFKANLSEGTYIIEETEAPDGYNKLDQKWVLVISKDDKGKLVKKVYNYSSRTSADEKSLLGEEGTRWVNVKDRKQIGWESFDNRNTGWAGNSTEAEHMGTRIIAINKNKKYVIQRYVINPEAIQTKGIDGVTSATIHREKPNYPNMDWYNGEDYKVFTLEPKKGADTDGKVTGLISDLRLADYTVTDITADVKQTAQSDSTSHYNETRLKLQIPETNKPIVIDVKIPYKDENGGVGTGMDWRENGITYWKSDYYERVSEIVLGDTVASEVGSIKGSYIGENSLDVTNEPKTYGFKIKKVKEGATETLIPGAKFKLIGPDPSTEEREMTTGSDGMISFNGLKPGKYELEETEPAPGYEKADKKWQVIITNEGKAYIKADEETSSTNRLAARRLQSTKANDGLEISDERVPAAQMADDGWMEVDPDRSSGRKTTDLSKAKFGSTKITEINKDTKRFRQEFTFLESEYGSKTREIQIHRQPESYDLKKEDITIKIYQADGTDVTSKIIFNNKVVNNKKYRIVSNKIPATIKGTLTVKIEAPYNPAYGIGLGSNYNNNTVATFDNKAWITDSYENESGIKGKVQNYTVSFAANGGNGTMDSQQVEEGQTFTLPENKFTPPSGKEFKAWSVNGEEKAPQDTITVNADIEVTAIWKDAQVTISFDGNGGTYQKAPEKVDKGSSYMLPGNPFIAPEGKEFAGWIVGSSIKQPGESIIVDNDITIKAQWKNKAPETYTITVSKLENGTLIPSTNSATAGTEVKLTVTPDDGYEIDSVTINGKALSADASGNYKFTMPAANVTLSATFKKKQEEIKPPAGAILIKDEGYPITNKQTGLEFTVFKVNNLNRRLPDAEFTIVKYKDNTYKELDGKFTKATGTSDENGLVQFKDENGNVVSLPKGHYIITETKAPEGYKKAQAPWKLEVYEEAGQLKAKYSGPEDTANGLLTSDKAKAQSNNSTELQKTNNGIKYKSRLTYINPESKTYVKESILILETIQVTESSTFKSLLNIRGMK
ncbi:SpaA isopeptide-forming pilin-related protein [Anaerococcus sp. Marseille-Q7828]|uniref:SpaA isopeptide-forming pilin-related protein n=1 Tax=Anaerococcus sp. Marseille-Q7828 TaxID=3036300 RepID=UPI0024AE0919|nr:SpaA isopeptide-forming pilin-related protein [Anaerococcus sp. Marseille-Q7828]